MGDTLLRCACGNSKKLDIKPFEPEDIIEAYCPQCGHVAFGKMKYLSLDDIDNGVVLGDLATNSGTLFATFGDWLVEYDYGLMIRNIRRAQSEKS